MAGINEELTAEEWKKRYEKEKKKVAELKKKNNKMEEELRRWRSGDIVSLEEQEQLELEETPIRASVNSTDIRWSADSKTTLERDSQTEYHDDIYGEMLTNGGDYKVHEMQVNQLNYKIAGLEKELQTWRSGSDVPIEDQFHFDIDEDGETLGDIKMPFFDIDFVSNENEIHPSSSKQDNDTLTSSPTKPRKEEGARRGILNKDSKENKKTHKKSVTIGQPNDTKSQRQPQKEDAGRIKILTESNKAQKETINQLNNTISELENELEIMRSGMDLPDNERIYFGHEATEDASSVHDTLTEVFVQGLTILKEWAVSLVSGLLGAVNKLATCVASATHSQPHSQGYGTLAN